MSRSVKVDWYSQDVVFAVEKATDKILTQLAFEGEGIAKSGAPVDTGFMRNAIYAIAPGGSHRAQAEADAAETLAGTIEARGMVSTVEVEPHEAAIHGAAEYTAFQEMRVGFMYAALQALQEIAPGIIRAVGRETIGD